jgi:hypothetical protein
MRETNEWDGVGEGTRLYQETRIFLILTICDSKKAQSITYTIPL